MTCSEAFERVVGVDRAEADILASERGNLYFLPRRSPEEASALNDAALARLRALALPKETARVSASLSNRRIRKLYRALMKNDQVQESLCGTYGGSPQMGFCWGRGVAAHLIARQADLNTASVRKVWALGPLDGGWSYHMTTIVRRDDGAWIALDPIFGREMPVEEWYATMRTQFDKKGTMRLFSTEATRFSPESWEKYSRDRFSRPGYYNFFADLINAVYEDHDGAGVGPWKQIAESNAPAKAWRDEVNARKAKEAAFRMKKLIQLMSASGATALVTGFGVYEIKQDQKASGTATPSSPR